MTIMIIELQESEKKKKDKWLDLSRKLKKLLNKKVTVIPIVINNLEQRFGKQTGSLGNKRTSGDHPD